MDKLLSLTNARAYFFSLFMITCIFFKPTDSGAVKLTRENIDTTLASNELVFINFCTEWSDFCDILMPIFDKAADAISKVLAKEFPNNGQLVMGKVDCDQESAIATRFRITKYPTLKIFRNGQPAKSEYKGEGSVKAFTNFIRQELELEDPIKEWKELGELGNLESNKRIIIGYFDSKDGPDYNIFRQVASQWKDDCQFHVAFGEAFKRMHPPGQPIIVFRPDKDRSNKMAETYTGSLKNLNEFRIWVQEKCIPLVRELTSENEEELTEERLPFLILFHAPDDKESIKRFNEIVQNNLISEKENITFLTADGNKFASSLRKLGKSEKDLPLIAIDTFRHMYLFPEYKDMEVPGKLQQFLKDLYSGKLHREFHYGPDSEL